jgi:hypothetical protein
MSMAESGLMGAGPGIWSANVLFAAAAFAGLHLAYKERFPSISRFPEHVKTRFLRRAAAKEEKE